MRHSSPSAVRLTLSVSLAAILFEILFPETALAWSYWILLLAVVVVGIPHGAIDHIIAGKMFRLSDSWRRKFWFNALYLGLMLIVVAVWLIHPVAGLMFFLIMSVYHFGQADMEDFLSPEARHSLWYVMRGLFVVGLIVFTDTRVSFAIIAQATGLEPASVSSAVPEAGLVIPLLFAAYALVFGYAAATGRLARRRHFLYDSLLVGVVFIVTGPIVGFAVYFALWHSTGHIMEMQRYLHRHKVAMPLPAFYKAATPHTLISFIALGVLVGVVHVFAMDDRFVALMLILISVLTLPHMAIVDRMYRQQEPGTVL
ncbi:Brp/Blh family beta-carotene 15,15'-dioxygenase [Balneolales bacterium ANBcel1]|nr:Brp/Blh family beta-carotene 15,15'-dioxygenase [Balneolales bacterium ANBcel1]